MHNEVVYRLRDDGSEILIEASGTHPQHRDRLPHERRAPRDARRRAVLRARLARDDPAPPGVSARPGADERPTAPGAATGIALGVRIALAALCVSLPIAIFLTWWGDCLEEACASRVGDRSDGLPRSTSSAWLVFPALAFGAYRGWRPAAGGACWRSASPSTAQVVAAILGRPGFSGLRVRPPGRRRCIATAGVIGLAAAGRGRATGPSAANEPDRARSSSRRHRGDRVPGLARRWRRASARASLVLVAVSLAFIAVLAFLNREPAATAAHRIRRGAAEALGPRLHSSAMRRISRKAESFTESVIREMNRLAVDAGAVSLAQGFPDFPAPAGAQGRGRGRAPRRHQPVRDHLGRAAAARGDRGEDRPLPPGLGARPRDADHRHLRRDRGDDRGDARAPRPGRRGDRLRAVLRELRPDAILSGAVPRYVTLHEPDWSIDPDELRAAVTPRTRAIVVNSPHNPTGKVFRRDELELIAGLCQRARPARLHRRHLRAHRLRGRAHPARDAPGHGRPDGLDRLDVEDVLRDRLAGRLGHRLAAAERRHPAGPRLPDRRRGGAAPAGGGHRARVPGRLLRVDSPPPTASGATPCSRRSPRPASGSTNRPAPTT